MSEPELASKGKMKNCLHKGTFPTVEAKNLIKAYYMNKKEACEILNTLTEDLDLAANGEIDTTRDE